MLIIALVVSLFALLCVSVFRNVKLVKSLRSVSYILNNRPRMHAEMRLVVAKQYLKAKGF